jgi:hypothetical protein
MSREDGDWQWRRHANAEGRAIDAVERSADFCPSIPMVDHTSSQGPNPCSYLSNNSLSGTDPTGYDCQEDRHGAVASSCLLSNNGVNKITDSTGKTLGTVIVADKGSTISLTFSNGGSLSATFTGKTGDISRVLNGPASSDKAGSHRHG